MSNNHNIEFKAFYDDREKAIDKCKKIGATLIRTHQQKDTYYDVKKGKMKLREDQEFGNQIIYYDRLANSIARSSHYNKVDITPLTNDLSDFFKEAFGIKAIIEKHRITYETEYALINIDNFPLIGNFIEVEVLMEKANSTEKGLQVSSELQNYLEIEPNSLVSFSYADLLLMYEKAASWRKKINESSNAGKLFLVDGCSCSGKTSLTQQLSLEQNNSIKFIRRYCTRPKRINDNSESEYVFVDANHFYQMASNGEFIEFRDFDFGMSYGLSWKDVMSPIVNGHNAFGIINFGSILHIKKIFPEAITILINAPLETIKKRLNQRGYNATEQIEERLENAKLVDSYIDYYDYVINNDDGMFNEALEQIHNIISSE